MPSRKNIALVAHDPRKPDLLEWVDWNHRTLLDHTLVCTGTTGRLVEELLARKLRESERLHDFRCIKLKSAPLGGDQQLGARIAEGKIDVLIFFWDPMEPQPHDVDVKALLRIAVVYNVPTACNRATADYLITSPLLERDSHPAPSDSAGSGDQDVRQHLRGRTLEKSSLDLDRRSGEVPP